MILSIDTSNPDSVTFTLVKKTKTIQHIFKTDHNLSEILVPEIQKFLAKQKVALRELAKIEAATGEGHFSRLRTAVATANALAFGLGINQPMIAPVYSAGPNITLKK